MAAMDIPACTRVREMKTEGNRRWIACGLLLASLAGVTLAPSQAQQPRREIERVLARGRALFLARCAECHNERGDKPLASGRPLNERILTDEAIRKNIEARFRKASEEDQRAVAAYLKSLLKNPTEQR